MSKGKTIYALLAISLILLPFYSQAKESDKLKKQLIFDQKRLVIEKNMTLSEEEEKFFWPVFYEYQEKLLLVDEQMKKLIDGYILTDQIAHEAKTSLVVSEYFKIRENRLKLNTQFARKLAKKLPPKKVFRYFQLENKIDADTKCELTRDVDSPAE
jgi:hypothetical protein